MTEKKHSRKLSLLAAVLILLCGVFLGGYLVLKSGRIGATNLKDILSARNEALLKGACEPNANDQNKDSDNDGLKDWQEIQLYKTEPCNPDSDGDGYLDGEEILSGYDPLKKAPDDILAGAKPVVPRPLPKNLTAALTQLLKEQIAANKITPFNAQGGLLSSDELEQYPGIQQIVEQIANNNEGLFAPDFIDDNQIKTTSDNSRAAIQKFAAAASLAIPFSGELQKSSLAEMDVFTKAIQDNDTALLDIALANYQKAYEDLKTLTVPSDLLPLYKEQLEIFSSTIKIYQTIKETNIDPLKTNLALQAYQAIEEEFMNWLQKLSDFAESHQ